MSLDVLSLIIPEDRLDVLPAKYPIHQIVVFAIRVFLNREVDVHILDLGSSCGQGDPDLFDDKGVPLIEDFRGGLRILYRHIREVI
jgi:hypothetical protein